MIPFIDLIAQRNAYKNEFEEAEKRVLESGCYIGGIEVESLEKELSEYTKSPYVITCGSGTQALEIALNVLNLKPFDEVIVPDFTFIAPAECVKKLCGNPRFADINPLTLQLEPESVQKLITKKTKGIIAVNLFGQCAPYKELKEIAQGNGLWIIEDSAQSFGAKQNGINACTFGDISITSFYPTKPLGCYGDGGAIFTANKEYAERVKILANHGSKKRYEHLEIGTNSRLDSIQAAILRVKLKHLDEELKKRKENAQVYNLFFENKSGFLPQQIALNNTSSYAQYTLLVDNRDDFIENLNRTEIPYCIHYPKPLHLQPCFKEIYAKCPVTESICKKVISLPFCAFTNVNGITDKLNNYR